MHSCRLLTSILCLLIPLSTLANESLESTRGAAIIANSGEADHACQVATDEEVAKWFGDTQPHQRDDSQLSKGIAGCRWVMPTNVLTAHTFKATRSAEAEARARAAGISPAKAGGYRYEPYSGMGDEATMVVEAAPSDAASAVVLIVVHNGDNMAALTAKTLVGSREQTVKVFKALGRKAAGRI